MAAKDVSLIHASMGRCGSWWFCHSVEGHFNKFVSFFNFGDIVFSPGELYKTHDYPPPAALPHMKIVYMFGNPMNIVVSAMDKFHYGESMVGKLYYSPWEAFYKFHNADYTEHHKIYDKDTLHLEENFDRWYKPQPFPFVAIKYEEFVHADKQPLYDFLGFSFAMLPYKKRQSDWQTRPQASRLKATYGKLADKIDAAPAIKIFDPVAVKLP